MLHRSLCHISRLSPPPLSTRSFRSQQNPARPTDSDDMLFLNHVSATLTQVTSSTCAVASNSSELKQRVIGVLQRELSASVVNCLHSPRCTISWHTTTIGDHRLNFSNHYSCDACSCVLSAAAAVLPQGR